MLTIVWIFTPFFYNLILILLDQRYRKDWKKGMMAALKHLPLVIPLTNTYYTYRLSQVQYSNPMTARSLAEIEELRLKAGQLTLTEAFLVRMLSVCCVVCCCVVLYYIVLYCVVLYCVV